jgi:hypothetical protein
MALSKAKTMANGASGNYWKITSAVVNKKNMSVVWTLTLFMDKAHADAGSPLGSSYQFTCLGLTKAQLAMDILALGYVNIMAQVAAGAPKVGAPGSISPQAVTDLTGATSV